MECLRRNGIALLPFHDYLSRFSFSGDTDFLLQKSKDDEVAAKTKSRFNEDCSEVKTTFYEPVRM
jgi:hypothetical protein